MYLLPLASAHRNTSTPQFHTPHPPPPPLHPPALITTIVVLISFLSADKPLLLTMMTVETTGFGHVWFQIEQI